MNIRAMRIFRLVVTKGSLAAAAEAMSLSPPAASRLLSLLEAELKLQLFDRSRRRLTLTAQGEAFYRESEHILAGFDEIPRIASDVRSQAKGQLRIITAPRIGQGIVAPALALFCREHPEVRATVDVQSRVDIEGRMGTRLYDLGIISLPVSHPLVEIENHPLFRVRMEAILPERHRLARKPTLTAADLAGEPLLGLWPGQPWRRQVDDFFRSGGVQPEYAIETRSSLMACQLVRDGAGVVVLDRLCVRAIAPTGVVVRALVPERWILFGYIHQTRHPPGANATAFLDCLRRSVEAFRSSAAQNAEAVIPVWPGAGAVAPRAALRRRGSSRHANGAN